MLQVRGTKLDPFALDGDPSNDHLITTQFQLPPVNRPEDQMCGAMYNEPIGAGPVNADVLVTDASNWIFQGSNVQNGTHLHGLLGSEVDELFANIPAGWPASPTLSILISPMGRPCMQT